MSRVIGTTTLKETLPVGDRRVRVMIVTTIVGDSDDVAQVDEKLIPHIEQHRLGLSDPVERTKTTEVIFPDFVGVNGVIQNQ